MSRRRKLLMFTMIVLVLAVLVSAVRHFQLRWSLEACIARLKAEGEPLSLAQVIPPPLPQAENGAPLITNALAQIYSVTNSMMDYNPDYNPPYAMNQTIPGAEMVGWRQPLIHSPDTWPRQLTNTWQELGAQLSQYRDDLNDFRKLIQKPGLDFHMDYSNVSGPGLMSHLPQIKVATQWLMALEFYDLHQDKTADACTDVRAMLALVKGETDERFEISQLVRFAIAQITAGATWDILQTTNVTDHDLAQLQQDWQSLDFVAPMRGAFLFERVNSMELQNQLRHFHADLMAFAQFPPSSFVVKSKINGKWTDWNGSSTNFYMIDKTDFDQGQRPLLGRVSQATSELWHFLFSWPAFYSYEDEQRGLREWQIMFTGTKMAETNASFLSVQSFVRTNFFQLGFGAAEENRYAVFSRNAYQLPALRKAIQAEITRNVVVTAIALKRYQLRHDHLPDTLDELVPEFVKSVPTDCMDGRPLRYRRNADGTFLLYSVGDNGKDDGGNPAWEKTDETTDYYDWQNAHALDWVWPQPATPEEIQAYYARKKSGD